MKNIDRYRQNLIKFLSEEKSLIAFYLLFVGIVTWVFNNFSETQMCLNSIVLVPFPHAVGPNSSQRQLNGRKIYCGRCLVLSDGSAPRVRKGMQERDPSCPCRPGSRKKGSHHCWVFPFLFWYYLGLPSMGWCHEPSGWVLLHSTNFFRICPHRHTWKCAINSEVILNPVELE